MKCLRCKTVDLVVKNHVGMNNKMEIDMCPTCQGTWLDSEELHKIDDGFFINLEEIAFDAATPTVEDPELQCSRCDGSPGMKKVSPPGHPRLVIDICPSCKGFWLDNGEIEKMRKVSDSLLVADLVSLL